MQIFKKISEGLKKTSNNFSAGINDIFNKSKPSNETLQDLEDFMISSDIGIPLTEKIIENVKSKKFSDDELNKKNFLEILTSEILEILEPVEKSIFNKSTELETILVCGVNGTGKTTTIGKLCKILKDNNSKVIVGAADTFRAAAIEQLDNWCQKNSIDIEKSNPGTDPAAVAFKTLEKAKKNNYDYCIIDTAGRLHNKKNLMDEFSKIIRVMKKIDENAPQKTIIVLDATTGQNALNQIEEFNKISKLSGLIMTKLDGTAKGGVLLSITKKYKLPIFAIGVGEKEDDLQPFVAKDFVKAFLEK
ncbi:MAG: signal recognition particle-docking protein FtsY [Pelagibacteraceae bacterium]|jgi:fused signal recognition particle receptor